MLKLKALLLTQGMHGMVSQAEGLAKASVRACVDVHCLHTSHKTVKSKLSTPTPKTPINQETLNLQPQLWSQVQNPKSRPLTPNPG